jgi:L-fucono-1,5-lactonase
VIIDAHHHFWKYTPAEYGWIDDEMAVIRRDFLPADLERAIRGAGVDGVVTVQARQTVEETAWTLDLADKHDFIRGVVGWLPLTATDIEEHLERFAANPKLKGVRHVLQGEPGEYMSRADFNSGLSRLRRYDLVYDILIVERQLPAAIELVDRHPNQTFVLDHLAKPRIRERVLSPWQENIVELARRPNVYCKLSGMVTEADYRTWQIDDLRPYVDTVLDAFGGRRVMFGSDWPVCMIACGYARWLETVKRMIYPPSRSFGDFIPTEQDQILGGTAARAYRLEG